MSSQTFRKRKNMRKTRRNINKKKNLTDSYLVLNVGGAIETYKLKKQKKNFKLGGFEPIQAPVFTDETTPQMLQRQVNNTLYTIQEKGKEVVNSFQPKPQPIVPVFTQP